MDSGAGINIFIKCEAETEILVGVSLRSLIFKLKAFSRSGHRVLGL